MPLQYLSTAVESSSPWSSKTAMLINMFSANLSYLVFLRTSFSLLMESEEQTHEVTGSGSSSSSNEL